MSKPQVIGIHPGCGGTVAVKDWGNKADRGFRYEAWCSDCLACDPNGYGSRREVAKGAAEYFKIKSLPQVVTLHVPIRILSESNRPWSDGIPSADQLWKAYEAAGTLRAAGKRFGRSAQTMLNWMRVRGVTRRSRAWSEADVAELRRLYGQMPSIKLADIAKAVGRSRMAVALKANEIGLTDYFRPKAKRISHNQIELPWKRWIRFPHPRGFAGKQHGPEARATISQRAKRTWAVAKATRTIWMSPENLQRSSDRMSVRNIAFIKAGHNCYSRAKQGRRADLGGIHFRSAWEANFARYLNFLVSRGEIEKWEYESHTFWFERIKRGVRSYTPDFEVWPMPPGGSYFVEVKGWMDPKSKTKLKRMKKYYPTVKIEVVDEKRYNGIAKTAGALIANWEGRR